MVALTTWQGILIPVSTLRLTVSRRLRLPQELLRPVHMNTLIPLNRRMWTTLEALPFVVLVLWWQ